MLTTLAAALPADADLFAQRSPRESRTLEPSVVGQIVSVSAEGARLVVAEEPGGTRIELRINAATQVRLGTRRIATRSLRALLGSRVKVRYRTGDGGELIARVITVDRSRR